MWAGLTKSTRNAEAPKSNGRKPLPFSGLKGQKDERNSVIGARSLGEVPARQEPLFRDATMTRAETPKRNESEEEIPCLFFLPASLLQVLPIIQTEAI